MKNICIITGTRADYGLLKNLIKEIDDDPYFKLILFVTGSHLEEKYGHTYKNIIDDGFKIDEKINMDLIDDSPMGIVTSMSKEMESLAKSINNYNIDIMIILGDRYEMLVAASVALIYNIKIAHIAGGDITEGAYDNYIRNSITKLSSYHFVTCKSSYQNLINMGEYDKNVFLVGNPGIYDLINFKPIDTDIFYNEIKLPISDYILVIYHPETLLDKDQNITNFNIFLDSLMDININIVFIMPNADNYNDFIFKEINKLKDKENIFIYRSLKRVMYINLINYSKFVIGNSSSGIYEVPLLKKITLNIGIRQKGRDHGNSVINIDYNQKDILYWVNKILNNEFILENITYPYEKKESYKIIKNILKKIT